MIDVNNKNKMQRHESIIQLADHVKNKLKQHQQLPAASSFIDSSDEFVEINSTDDENDSPLLIPPEHITRQRRDTYTTYDGKQSSGRFFTDRMPNENINISILEEEYRKQQVCEECLRRDRIINLQRQDLIRMHNQNKQLDHQLRSSILLNHQYENETQKLKHHLNKINSNLYEYQMNYDHLKQKIISEKKTNPKIDDDEEEEQEQEDVTIDHLKRLRHEIHMYNRLVAAKDKHESKSEQKQMHFLY